MDSKRKKNDEMKNEITEMKFDLPRPLLRVWYPKGLNKYGHVSLQTNKFYMSFWPKVEQASLKEDKGKYSEFWPTKEQVIKKSTEEFRGNKADKSFVVKAGLFGVDASLIFHPDFDCALEGDRFPDKREYIKDCSCGALNTLFEEFLNYNEINPSNVTLSRAVEIRKSNKTVQKGREIKPVRDLRRTEYTFLPKLHYKRKIPFYYIADAQSCVSFVYHMIEWTYQNQSKKITLEFFVSLFKILDSVFSVPPLKREVYVNVLMHTVDGKIVNGIEIMLENQLTGELENLNLNPCHRLRQTVEKPPIFSSYTVEQRSKRENVSNTCIGNIWTVPDFFSFISNVQNSPREDREVIYAFT